MEAGWPVASFLRLLLSPEIRYTKVQIPEPEVLPRLTKVVVKTSRNHNLILPPARLH